MTDLLDSRTAATPTVRRRSLRPAGWYRDVRARRFGDAGIAGAFAFLLSVAFSWVPSVWFDESATVVSATRSYKQLWAEVQTVDAVHATYYGLMHGWFDLVGYTPFTLRVPSAVATGLAAALVVLLAARLTDKRTGLVAGLVFAVLPRVTWMGAEGRSYATATLLAVALSLVLIHATTRPRPSKRLWALYGVLALAAGMVFLYVALVVVAHGLTLALWALRSRLHDRETPWRQALGGWVIASAAAALALIPLAHLASSQSRQINWILRPGWNVFPNVLGWQWFMANWQLSAVAWALVVVGVVSVLRRGARHNAPNVLQVVVPWMAVPTVGLIAVSVVSNPVYSPRYVTFGAPAVAILIAVGLTALSRRRFIAAGLVVLIALTAPSYVSQRQPEAKDNSSWAEVADLIAHERSLEPSGGDDAIIYGHLRRHAAASARNIAYTYPDAFAGLTDVTLKKPAAETGKLWEDRYALADTIERVDGHEYVWLVTSDKRDIRPAVTQALADEGFRVEKQWHLTYVNIVRYQLG